MGTPEYVVWFNSLSDDIKKQFVSTCYNTNMAIREHREHKIEEDFKNLLIVKEKRILELEEEIAHLKANGGGDGGKKHFDEQRDFLQRNFNEVKLLLSKVIPVSAPVPIPVSRPIVQNIPQRNIQPLTASPPPTRTTHPSTSIKQISQVSQVQSKHSVQSPPVPVQSSPVQSSSVPQSSPVQSSSVPVQSSPVTVQSSSVPQQVSMYDNPHFQLLFKAIDEAEGTQIDDKILYAQLKKMTSWNDEEVKAFCNNFGSFENIFDFYEDYSSKTGGKDE